MANDKTCLISDSPGKGQREFATRRAVVGSSKSILIYRYKQDSYYELLMGGSREAPKTKISSGMGMEGLVNEAFRASEAP